MEITVLGPLEVRLDGRLVALGGPKPRALLAMLALHGNEVVSRDRLIEALWGDRPPRSVDQSLDTYVSRLRRALGKERLSRRSGGYVLSIGPNELDLYRFEALVQEARRASAAGDVKQATRLLSEAQALWSGPALADVLYEPFASGEAARLEEKRLVAREDLFDAQLAMGAGAELVAELERLVGEQPLRERLLGQLMLALYRAGRHAEALAVLQAARHRLADELGLEPGPQLRELERQMLEHDERLDVPRLHARPIGGGRRRALAVVAVLAATAATAAGIIILATGAGNEPLKLDDVSNRLLSVGAHSGRVGTAIDLAGSPAAVAFGAGSVWVADPGGQVVERVDPASGAVADRIAVGGEPGSIVWGGGAVWVASTLGGSIKRIDPATDTVTQAVGMGGASVAAMAFGVGGLWVADATDRALVEIDPASGSIRRTLTLDLSPSSIAVGPRAVWVAGSDAGKVEEIDVASGETLGAVPVGRGPSALVIDEHAVWVANSLDATLSRIDPATGSVVATIAVGSGPSAIAASAGSIWVANTYSASVSRIDPNANKIVETIRVGGRPGAIAPGRGNVWIASASQGDTHRGGTLTLLTKGPFPSIDPAFQDSTAALTRLPYDTLVTYQASPGPAGLRLVPDIALAVPTPTGGGTTYAFRLRPGIRYSNGRPVRAGDFRRAIERLFRLDSPGASFYTSLAGAASCVRPRAHCSLSRGIVIDDAARAVVFHLRVPDPDFLFKLTLGFAVPIPPTTDPGRDSRAVPGTGPYRILDSNAHAIRLVRNRFFREWSHAAQPDGMPDRIIWRFGLSPSAQVQAIEHGRADWTADLIPPAVLHGLRIRAPGQLHENPSFDVQFVPLNTRLPPFDDVRVRQALNYAVDRAKIVRMYGGSVGATPICQPMPAGFAGYRRYCPYTLRPHRDGRWSAPNMARARRLVAASGTRGLRIDIWGATDLPGVSAQLPGYIGRVLRTLGYRTKLHLLPYAAFSPTMRRRIQLTVDGDWVPDYPSPSSYLPPFFSCNGGNNRKRYVCDRQLDRQMRQASGLELESPARAAALWTRIDHELVDRALWVPTVNVREREFVSARVRNYQYQPVWGFMADQAWLR